MLFKQIANLLASLALGFAPWVSGPYWLTVVATFICANILQFGFWLTVKWLDKMEEKRRAAIAVAVVDEYFRRIQEQKNGQG